MHLSRLLTTDSAPGVTVMVYAFVIKDIINLCTQIEALNEMLYKSHHVDKHGWKDTVERMQGSNYRICVFCDIKEGPTQVVTVEFKNN